MPFGIVAMRQVVGFGDRSTAHYLTQPWTLPTHDAKRHPDPIRHFFHNALDRPTDARTHARTYVQTDRSSTGKFDDYRPLRSESDAA